MGGSSPKTQKQEDPQVAEDKAKKQALALAQAYEAKSSVMGMGGTKLYGTSRSTAAIEQKGALDGFSSYKPISTDASTADAVYKKTTANQRNEMAAELEYTRRKRQVLGA